MDVKSSSGRKKYVSNDDFKIPKYGPPGKNHEGIFTGLPVKNPLLLVIVSQIQQLILMLLRLKAIFKSFIENGFQEFH